MSIFFDFAFLLAARIGNRGIYWLFPFAVFCLLTVIHEKQV